MKSFIIFIMAILTINPMDSQNFESIFGSKCTTYSLATSNSNRTLVSTSVLNLDYTDTRILNGITFIKSYNYLAQNNDNSMLFRLDIANNEIDTLMNLNLNLGDSIFIQRPSNFTYDEHSFRGFAHVIDKGIINGRLVIEFDINVYISDSLQVPLRFIEGVGVNCGETFNMKYESTSLVLCQTKNDTLNYMEASLNNCNYSAEAEIPDKIRTLKNSKNISNVFINNDRLKIRFIKPEQYIVQISTIHGQVICRTDTESTNEFSVEIPDDLKMFVLAVFDVTGKLIENHKILNVK